MYHLPGWLCSQLQSFSEERRGANVNWNVSQCSSHTPAKEMHEAPSYKASLFQKIDLLLIVSEVVSFTTEVS